MTVMAERTGSPRKETNPKDAVGVRKARWFSYVPLRVMVYLGLALLEGARKYGRHNYRIAGVRASVYVDAVVCGHLTPWMEGQDNDPDSGLNHIDKAIASLVVLRDGMLEGNWEDDRPPSIQNADAFFVNANAKAIEIIDRYPNVVPAYTIKDTVWKKTPDQLIAEANESRALRPMKLGCRHSLTTVNDPRAPSSMVPRPQIDECCYCGGEQEHK